MHLIIDSVLDTTDENGDPCRQVTAYGFNPTMESLQVVADYVTADKSLSRADVASKLAASSGISVKNADTLKTQGAGAATIKSILFNRCYMQLFVPSTDPAYSSLVVGQTLTIE